MKLIEIARSFVGQKELPGNKFEDTELGKLLHEAGQRDGEAWCAYFGEAMCAKAYPEKSKDIQKYFSASAVQTFRNFVAANFSVTAVPLPGSLVIWQKYEAGKALWQGHLGIVTEVVPGSFKSVEGNSNAAGSRDSDSVVENTRIEKFNPNGLSVMGFINLGYE